MKDYENKYKHFVDLYNLATYAIMERRFVDARNITDNIPVNFVLRSEFGDVTVAHTVGYLHPHENSPSAEHVSFVRHIASRPGFVRTIRDLDDLTPYEWALHNHNYAVAELLDPELDAALPRGPTTKP